MLVDDLVKGLPADVTSQFASMEITVFQFGVSSSIAVTTYPGVVL